MALAMADIWRSFQLRDYDFILNSKVLDLARKKMIHSTKEVLSLFLTLSNFFFVTHFHRSCARRSGSESCSSLCSARSLLSSSSTPLQVPVAINCRLVFTLCLCLCL